MILQVPFWILIVPVNEPYILILQALPRNLKLAALNLETSKALTLNPKALNPEPWNLEPWTKEPILESQRALSMPGS